MAWSYASHQANYTSTAAATSHTLTFGFTPTSGNLLVVWSAFSEASSVPSSPAGWTTATGTVSLGTFAWYFKISDGTETNFVIAPVSTSAVMTVREYSNATGINLNYVVDILDSATGVTSVSQGAVTARHMHSDDALVLAASYNVTGASFSGNRIPQIQQGSSTGGATNVTAFFGAQIRTKGNDLIDYRITQGSSVNASSFLMVLRPTPNDFPSVVQSIGYTESGAAGTSHQKTGITTTAGNRLIAAIATSANAASQVSGVTDSAGNTWAAIGSFTSAGNAEIEVWVTTAASPTAISSGNITVTTSGSKGVAFRVFEISGTYTATAPSVSAALSDGDAANWPTAPMGTGGPYIGLFASTGTTILTSQNTQSINCNFLGFAAYAVTTVGRTYSNPQWAGVAGATGVAATTIPGTTNLDESTTTSNNVALYTSYQPVPRGAGNQAAVSFQVTINSSTAYASALMYIRPSTYTDDDRTDTANTSIRPSYEWKLTTGYYWRTVDPYSTVPTTGQLWPRGFPKGTTEP